MFATITIFLCIALLCVLFISRRKFNYWKKKNVPHLKPTSIFGNYGDLILLKKYVGYVNQNICRNFPDEPYVGTFYGTEPALLIQDLELIKLIMTKDFYYFSSREVSKYTHNEVFTQNLFFTYGNRWKVLRQNLTPLFSSAKLKNMFPLIEKYSLIFEKFIDNETVTSSVLEVRSLGGKFTMDCVGSCAFGVDTNTMYSQEINNPFKTMGDAIFEISNVRGFKLIARAIWPFIFYGLGFKTFPTEIDNFFNKLLIGVFEGRQYKSSGRNDFVDLVLTLKKNNYVIGDDITNMKTGANAKVNLQVDDELLVAQCIVFFAAGYETSATTMSFTLYELAKNEEAQRRVIEEVDEYLRRHEGKIGYECVTELPYLDACIDEALRLYPVLGMLAREVVEDYTLPTGLCLEKGMRVHLPVYHLHHNPKHFPKPEQYRPERFFGEEKRNIQPYTYMPFGDGPRICIGMRFAKMQMLAGLVTILKKYRLELADNMPRNVKIDPRGIVTTVSEGINLKFVTRPDWEQRMFKRDT